ncbi:Trp biosynthesis-associated membrane protein [Micromonospora sp. NPDC050397]|uniref:Trp biosynthesis-associated membrane protein n=1 Tax=Micromonospora sp. NPDC050397 TaxID=3364279 RepID=UPI0038502873
MTGEPVPAPRPAHPGRRQLTYVLLLCLAGAGLALYAATRTWSVEITTRTAPLPPLRAAHTGGDLLPWLPALALVGLAASGALLATGGVGRRLVGGLMVLVGLGVAVGGGYGLGGPDGETEPVWGLLCVLGGLMVFAAGLVTIGRGQTWPAMGARYERTRSDTGNTGRGRSGGDGPDGGRVDAGRTVAAWDALDRGDDPTAD